MRGDCRARVPPRLLPMETAIGLFGDLRSLLESEGLPPIRSDLAAASIADEHIPLVYAVSRYGEVVEPSDGWRALAERMQSRLTA